MVADEVMVAAIEAWLEVTLGQKLGLADFHRESEHLAETILRELSESGFELRAVVSAATPSVSRPWWRAALGRG